MSSIICSVSRMVSILLEIYFLIFNQFKTLLGVTASQRNINTVYIRTPTYGRDTFGLKSISSQTIIREQPFLDDIAVSILTRSRSSITSLYRICN